MIMTLQELIQIIYLLNIMEYYLIQLFNKKIIISKIIWIIQVSHIWFSKYLNLLEIIIICLKQMI